jgi:thymidylate kinase
LLGPDGSGKSTLAEGLQSAFFSPVRSIHMALADYQIPRWARIRVPKVGAPGRFLVTLWRYLQGQYYRTRGWLAIFDRYTYDVLLPSEQQHTRVKQALRWLLAHTFPAPDVVILLDAPGHVVHARKGEYDPEHMEAHRQHLLRLRQRLPQLQVVDATQSKDAVRVDATSRIWQQYVARHGEKM